MATRSEKNLWLLNKSPIETITGARLPSKEQVLLRYYQLHRELKQTVSASTKEVIQEVMVFWEQSGIPTTTCVHAQTKLKKLVEAYERLKKTKNMVGDRHRMREDIFKGDLEEIFDIAHSTALERTDVLDIDKEFLRRQREDRSGASLGGVDVVFAKKKERTTQRQDRQVRLRQRASADATKLMEKSQISFDSSSESNSPSSASSPDRYSPCLPKVRRTDQSPSRSSTLVAPVRKAVRDLNLISTWDRENLSVRQATACFSATAQSLGIDMNTVSVSKSTVHRARTSGRKECAQKIREQKDIEQLERVVLHWDGKLLPEVSGSGEQVDRIAVVVTAEGGTEFFLGAPATNDSTGKNVAAVVLKEAEEAGVIDNVIGFGFDTTASNTGMVQGACIRMEKSLGRSMLWLACRHHIHEVVLKDVFCECLGSSNAPEVAIFKRLKSQWQFVDPTKKETVETCNELIEFFAANSTACQLKDDMLSFLKECLLSKSYPREDYEELLRLCFVFLGGKDSKPLRRPGALHQARWMAKALYCLKLQMLNSQLELTAREALGVRRMALFISLVYVRQWHEAMVSVKAPLNDVRFLNILRTYPDSQVAKVGDRALRRHLWYVTEENVAIGFFDERIPVNDKRLMVSALQNPATGKVCKRLEGKSEFISLSLSSFVTEKTRETFQKLGIDQGFLETDPSGWEEDPRYLEGRRRALDLKVVNDCAERGIALVQRYLHSTKSKEQEQYLLELVHHDLKVKSRKTKAGLSKKTF